MKNDSEQSSTTSDELEGKNPSKVVTTALRNDAHEIMRALAEDHKVSQIEFTSNLILGLQALSFNDITLLLTMGRVKALEGELTDKVPETSKYLLNIGKLIIIPIAYYRRLISIQHNLEKG